MKIEEEGSRIGLNNVANRNERKVLKWNLTKLG